MLAKFLTNDNSVRASLFHLFLLGFLVFHIRSNVTTYLSKHQRFETYQKIYHRFLIVIFEWLPIFPRMPFYVYIQHFRNDHHPRLTITEFQKKRF